MIIRKMNPTIPTTLVTSWSQKCIARIIQPIMIAQWKTFEVFRVSELILSVRQLNSVLLITSNTRRISTSARLTWVKASGGMRTNQHIIGTYTALMIVNPNFALISKIATSIMKMEFLIYALCTIISSARMNPELTSMVNMNIQIPVKNIYRKAGVVVRDIINLIRRLFKSILHFIGWLSIFKILRDRTCIKVTRINNINQQCFTVLWVSSEMDVLHTARLLIETVYNKSEQNQRNLKQLNRPQKIIQINLLPFYAMAEAVKVMIRCRPMNKKQKDRGCKDAIEVDTKNNQIFLMKEQNKQQPKSFSFDFVFAPDSAQALLYEQSAFSLVDNVLDGYNGTIFAYGQTGCGKTHTMMGSNESEEARGIIPRTFSQIITITKNQTSKTHLIRCSFIEIYNEEVHDLLSSDIKAKMQLKESPDKGVFVKDLNQLQVATTAKMEEYMDIGFKSRAVRATNMNNESSRSHSIFTIYIDSQENDDKGNEKYKASKLNLVDLAGSERISKTGTTGEGLKEATKINLSLSALGNVISALVDGKTHHIPYRDSKLTRLLQDSLGGNTKTIMIAAISPADYNYDETLSTLRYASRAKFIKNKPKINEDPKDALLREYMDEIKKLKMMLQGKSPMEIKAMGDLAASQERIVYRDGDNKENNTILEAELRNKQDLLRQEQEEKKILGEKLEHLQKLFDKGTGPGAEDKSEMEKIKKLKEKLKVQKKKEEEYQREKQRREEELLSIEKNYKSLNQQVDQMRERFQEIKKKYIGNLAELRDIQNEHEDEKQELLDTIRYQEKQIKKFNAIMKILMNSNQLDLIVNNSEWNEEKREWVVPYFTYRQKHINLPKLNSKSKQAIQEEKQKKEVVFRNSRRESEKRVPQQGGFKVNNIVKNAREAHEAVSSSSTRSNSMANRAQLTPLKNESYERAVGGIIPYNDDKKRKIDRLEPIQMGK